MNSDLKQFAIQYLSVVTATLMLVSFFAFVSIPFSLGGQPGEVNLAQASAEAPTQIALDAHESGASDHSQTAVRL